MKQLFLIVALAGATCIGTKAPRVINKVKFVAATCTGADPCKACKNCKYCKRCAKDNKTCGICKK